MSERGIEVLLANQDREELAALARLVEGEGYEVVGLAITTEQVADAVAEHRPDLAMVLIEEDEEHALDLVIEVRSFAAIPVVLMAREVVQDATLRYAADNAVEILNLPGDPETVRRVIESALDRHERRQASERRIGEFDGILERRSMIEQAKGILMERHDLDANEAFLRIRAEARRRQLRVVDVAESVITARSLLDPEQAVDAPG